ncbi:hypothetical protein BN903_88 [Halorubrum sp. AJ67]|nr:hypothetical protein BN903_88 [Halorubrum sp. AJ67]
MSTDADAAGEAASGASPPASVGLAGFKCGLGDPEVWS